MPTPSDTRPDPWTIRRVLQWSAAYFTEHGIDSPRAAAEILLAHSLNTERIRLYTDIDRPLIPPELESYKRLVRRRVQREPVAYITGSREFWGLGMTVGPEVLIPRPETERLVEAVLEILPADADASPRRIVELGTGSGAISIALAHERPRHRYVATDASMGALEIARENAGRHLAPGAVDFVAAAWLTAFRPAAPVMDIIVSNPPYIRSGDIPGLAPEIARYEPRLALDGSPDGLESYRVILHEAAPLLRPGGYLFVEIGHDQFEAVSAVAGAAGGYEPPVCFTDLAGLDRVVRIRRAADGPGAGTL